MESVAERAFFGMCMQVRKQRKPRLNSYEEEMEHSPKWSFPE